VTRWFEQWLDAFAPTSCVSCKSPGSYLCPACAAAVELNPRAVSRGGLSGVAVSDFDDVAASIVVAFKDQGRTVLKRWLADAVAESIRCRFANELNDPAELELVCLPSTYAAFRRRGYRPNEILTRTVSRVLNLPFRSGVITFSRQLKDQRGLNLAERRQNLSESMRSLCPPRRAILVDDVVTTGASLQEAARALQVSGCQVEGFAVFAETLRRT
ncbi:MAG: hypothetical protein RL719_28, partial [Actinomycetota bacterium]